MQYHSIWYYFEPMCLTALLVWWFHFNMKYTRGRDYIFADIHCVVFMFSDIYTTIAALSTKICPHKSVLKIRSISSRALSIRHRSWRQFLCAYMLPIPDLCASAFCVCPLFFYENKSQIMLFYLDAIFTLQFSRRYRHRRRLRTTTHNCAQLRTTSRNYAQLRTMVDFIVVSIKLVFMVLGVLYARVLYNN